MLAAAVSFSTGPARAQSDGEVVVSHGIGYFGPPDLGSDFTHLPYVNPDAPKGGEISLWTTGSFDSYNPFSIKGRGAALSTIMLETLLTGSSAEVGAAYCLICETIEYPTGREWVIFNLRPDVAFSDGTPLTASDVVFSYEAMRDKALASYRALLSAQVADAEALSPTQVKFTFNPNYPRRSLIQAVGGIPIFSRVDFARHDRDLTETSQIPFVGSGPYMFDAADQGRWVAWKRNPDYWGEDLPINRGRNNFDRIRYEYFGDYEAAFEAFKAGEYTFRQEASSIIRATRYDFPAFTKGHVRRETLPSGDKGQSQGWVFNMARPPFDEIEVREAIGLMFNFEWANEALFHGLYERAQGFWDNSDLSADGVAQGAELEALQTVADDLPDGVLTGSVVTAPISGTRQLDRRNLRAAGALLDRAGWTVGPNGMRSRDGQALSLEILNDSPTFDRVLNPFISNLRALGIDASQLRVDDAEHQTRLRSKDFDMISHVFRTDLLPSGDVEQSFGSAHRDDAFNASGLANPAVDKLATLLIAADSRDELRARARAIDRVLRALHIWVPQWYDRTRRVAYWDMYDHPETLPPYDLGVLDFWWFDADKAAKLKEAGALR